jgi:hypothetical protein
MKRRRFLQSLLAAGSGATLWPAMGVRAGEEYQGRFLVSLIAAGGWDVTSLCDPKLNVPGEPEINWWARTGEIQTAGNILYAPFGNNHTLFQNHFDKMLVINGLDSQTNAHEAGVLHNFSGRLSAGFPSLPALFSTVHAPDLPMTYINNGGYAETANLTRYTRLSEAESLSRLLAPNAADSEGHTFIPEADLAAIVAAQESRNKTILDSSAGLPRYRRLLDANYKASLGTRELQSFLDIIPTQEELAPIITTPSPNGTSTQDMMRQAQMSVLAFKAGVAAASDLIIHDLDTHGENDRYQEPNLAALADGVDYLWNYAEEHGVADRMTVVINSDFGRTPMYNSGDGKDHWPIGSVIIMEKNAPWGNRVVGITDEGHNALPLNPDTLQRDDSGTVIYPRHIHLALREYLGLAGHPALEAFPFNNTELFDFFNPGLQTAGRGSDPRNSVRIV